VVCNYLALLGWAKGDDVERFGIDQFVGRFELESIGKSNARFDREKLAAFNFDTIQSMDPAQLAKRWREWCGRYDPEVVERLGDRLELAAGAVRQRAKTLRQMREPLGFLFADEVEFDGKAVRKVLHKNEGAGLAVLGEMREVLKGVDPWESAYIEGVLERIGDARGLGMGQIAQPLRVALTGTAVSPGLGDTLALVGRDESLRRIDRCLRECQP